MPYIKTDVIDKWNTQSCDYIQIRLKKIFLPLKVFSRSSGKFDQQIMMNNCERDSIYQNRCSLCRFLSNINHNPSYRRTRELLPLLITRMLCWVSIITGRKTHLFAKYIEGETIFDSSGLRLLSVKPAGRVDNPFCTHWNNYCNMKIITVEMSWLLCPIM